jgi:AcrR family transcriptional regulator
MPDSTNDRTPARPHDESPAPALDRPDVLADEVLTAPPRQERSRRSREALIAAARSRFASYGYDATAVEDVAKDAGVAVGGFYVHFRSKRKVLLVLVDRLAHGFFGHAGHGAPTRSARRCCRRSGRDDITRRANGRRPDGVARERCDSASRGP